MWASYHTADKPPVLAIGGHRVELTLSECLHLIEVCAGYVRFKLMSLTTEKRDG